MKEIKFRIFIGGSFFYWGFLNDSFVGLPQVSWETVSQQELKERSQQYIGLNDKNDQEIYLGDIIKVDDNWEELGFSSGIIGEVIFTNSAKFAIKDNNTGVVFHFEKDMSKYLKVIGNIYENKDKIR